MRTAWLLAAALTATLAPTATANFTVTGKFQYRDKAFTFGGGFTGAEPNLPIRLATVQVVNAASGQVLATGATSETGDVSLSVPGTGAADVVVRCFSRSEAFGTNPLRVTNISAVEYSVSSSTYAGWDLGTNLAFGTVTAQKVFVGTSQGGPFNMLDMLVASVQYAKSLGAANPSATLRMVWPAGDSFASGNVANIATDDGYDDIVQLHEAGHVIHNHYSDNDQVGAQHTFGQSDQDPRLSFGEGWATYFAGAVRRHQGLPSPGIYLDCAGSGQVGSSSIQLRMRFEDAFPYSAETVGEADEGAVFCALWDLIDTPSTDDGLPGEDDPVDGSFTLGANVSPERFVWNVFTGPVKTATELTVRDFWNGLFAPTYAGHDDALRAVFQGWAMRFSTDAFEPDDVPAAATPIVPSESWGPIRTLFAPPSGLAAPGEGDVDLHAFQASAGTVIEVETRYPGGLADAGTYCDPRIELRRPDGTVLASDDDGGVGRNAKLTQQALDQSGLWLVAVHTVHPYRRTGSYELRVRVLSPPACPTLAASSTSGAGKPGAAGTPLLAAPNPVVGAPGFAISLSSAPASLPGLLLIGATAVSLPFDGGALLVDPALTIPISADASGGAQWPTGLTDPALCGSTVHLQAIFPGDPGATGPYHTSQSPRLTLTLGV